MNKLLELFCDVDDFCSVFLPQWQQLANNIMSIGQ